MPCPWVRRYELKLAGTNYGCVMAQCGACTVHVDGAPVRACVTPASSAAGKNVLTIEGLGERGLHRVQQAWIEHEVPQCGYCQTGMIMAVASLLEKHPKPTDAQIRSEERRVGRGCGRQGGGRADTE